MLSSSMLMPQNIDDIHAIVVWLHGMGEEPMTMLDVAMTSRLCEMGVGSVALKAPMQHFSRITGEVVDAWFDQEIDHLEVSGGAEVEDAAGRVDDYINFLIKKTGNVRIVVAGFSQGAALALFELVRHPDKFLGALLYSPYKIGDNLFFPRHDFKQRQPTDLVKPRVWIGYGLNDWVIPARWSYSLATELRNSGFSVVTRHYLGGHVPFSGAQEDIRNFLRSLLL